MKKSLLSLLTFAAFAVGIYGPALADDRLKPYTSINELTELAGTGIASGDYLLGFDASVNDWVKTPANSFGVGTNFEDVTAANTLTTAECGKTMTLNSATEFASTLPAPTAGCYFKFIIKAAPSGAAYTILSASGADVIHIHVNELETDTGDDGPWDDNADTVTFADGVAATGDYLECISDGTGWYCNGQTKADGGITSSTT